MGFRLDRTYALRWDDGDLAGLEVDIRSTSVANVLVLREAGLIAQSDELAKLLAEHVKRWNYEDEAGNPLPVAPESFLSLEAGVFVAITKAWYQAATGVTAPLDDGSTDGSPLPVASIPVDG